MAAVAVGLTIDRIEKGIKLEMADVVRQYLDLPEEAVFLLQLYLPTRNLLRRWLRRRCREKCLAIDGLQMHVVAPRIAPEKVSIVSGQFLMQSGSQ